MENKIKIFSIKDEDLKYIKYKKKNNNFHTNNIYSQSGCSTHTNTSCYDAYKYSYGYSNHTNYSQSVCGDTYSESLCYHANCTDCVAYGVYSYAYGDYYTNYHAGYDCYGRCSHYKTSYSNSYSTKYSQSGCSDKYSVTGYNYGYSEGYSNHSNAVTNYSPTISGTPPLNSGGTYNRSIAITFNFTITDTDGDTGHTYNIFYKLTSATTWTKGPQRVSKTYTWDTSALPAGQYNLAFTVWDGQEDSAVFSSGKFTAPTGATASYLTTTTPITISHYEAPAWGNTITANSSKISKADMDELRTEINKAREAYGLDKITFTDTLTVH